MLAACAAGPCAAETLARLTVTSFTLTADARPQVEVPFHVVVTAHVRERISQLDNLDLPILADVELLGDERRWTADGTGTTYREIITVVAHHTGTIHLAPATLDCIDARDGKAKRYTSNALDIAVGGGAPQTLQNARSAIEVVGRLTFALVTFLVGTASVILVVVLLFRRRAPRAAPVLPPGPPEAPPPPRSPRSREDDVRDALLALRSEPTRPQAMRVRALMRHLVGANERETLHDVLARPQAQEAAMREVLRTLERAAFTYDGDLANALDAAIAALERLAA